MNQRLSKWIKLGGLALGALLLVAIIAATYLIATFDANRYKGLAIDWMRENKQRTLAIDGPVGLRVFPRLEVKLAQVSLSEHQRSDEFARIEEAALSVDVMPLLRKQLVVDRVEARGVRLRYSRDAQGKRNIDDLLAPADDTPASAPQGAASERMSFDVKGLRLDDVRLSINDAMAKLRGDITVRKLVTGRLADKANSEVTLDAQLALEQPAVQGELMGETQLQLDLASTSAALRDMALQFKGAAMGVQAIDARLGGMLAYDGAQNALHAEDLKLDSSATLTGVKVEKSSLSLKRFGFEPQRKTLSLEQLELKVDATRLSPEREPMNLGLSWPRLQVADRSLKGSALQGELSLGGARPLQAKFSSSAPSGNFDEVLLPGFHANLSSGGGQRKVGGEMRADLTLQPSRVAVGINKLELQAQVQDPSMKPLAISLRGQAQASTQAAQWKLSGSLNDNAFSSDGSAAFAGTVPTVNARAQFSTLDLNQLLAQPKPGQPPASGAAPTPVRTEGTKSAAADTPVDLSALRSLQGSFSLKAGKLIYQRLQLGDAQIEATLDGGMLRVPRFAGRIWSGSIDGSAFADARAQRVTLKSNANNINIAAALRDVAQKDVLEGTGRLTLDVESAGKSVNEMKSRLAGKAALQLRDGAVKGINLARTLRQAKAAVSMKQDAVQQGQQAEKTDFSEMSASFAIADGVARNKDFDAKSPFLRLGGEGAIDIGRNRIDYLALATVVGTSKGQGGDELAALKGLTVPVELTGPLEAIAWKVQWSTVAAALAETTVRNKLEERLKDKLGVKGAPAGEAGASPPAERSVEDLAKDKLKDKLKGIFK